MEQEPTESEVDSDSACNSSLSSSCSDDDDATAHKARSLVTCSYEICTVDWEKN